MGIWWHKGALAREVGQENGDLKAWGPAGQGTWWHGDPWALGMGHLVAQGPAGTRGRDVVAQEPSSMRNRDPETSRPAGRGAGDMVARGPDSLGTQRHRDQVAQGMRTHQHGPSWDTSPRCQPGATQQWQCHQATCAGPTCRKLAPPCWARTGPAGPVSSPPARRGRRGHTGSIGGDIRVTQGDMGCGGHGGGLTSPFRSRGDRSKARTM